MCWNLGKVEKSGKKCEKMTIFGKSLKSGKIWTNFEQYFLPRKIRNSGKFWKWSNKKCAGICGFGQSLKIRNGKNL